MTSLDSGLYILQAYEFTQGHFDWGERPGFVLLLGTAFKILGPSVWSATVVIRSFFFFNVALIFFLSRYIFNKQIAFVASLTLLSSYYLTFLSHRVLLDNIHPFFIIFAIFLTILAVDRQSIKISVLAALLFVYAYMVKSTTLLFIPFPVLLVLLTMSTRVKLSNLREAGVVFVLSVFGITGYHFLLRIKDNSNMAGRIIEGASGNAIELLFAESIVETLQNFQQGFFDFWRQYLFQDSMLGWLFISAWIWIILRSIKNRNARPLAAVFLLFVPAMVYLGLARFRIGQVGIFLFVTFIPVGVLICDLSKWVTRIFFSGKRGETGIVNYRIVTVMIVALAMAVSLFQVFFAKRHSRNFLQYTYVGYFLQGEKKEWKLEGTFSSDAKMVGEIISEHGVPGSEVIAGLSNIYALNFFAREFKVSQLRTRQIKLKNSLKSDFSKNLPKGSIKGSLLFLWPNGWVKRVAHWNDAGDLRIRYMDEKSFLRGLKKKTSFYVALDSRFRHIGDYFDKSPQAQKLSSDPLVYQIDKFGLLGNYKPRVAYEIGMMLHELRKKNRKNYRIIRKKIFHDYFNFTLEQVDALSDLDEEAAGVVFIGYPNRSYQSILRKRKL